VWVAYIPDPVPSVRGKSGYFEISAAQGAMKFYTGGICHPTACPGDVIHSLGRAHRLRCNNRAF
jgi:hypothetical protein